MIILIVLRSLKLWFRQNTILEKKIVHLILVLLPYYILWFLICTHLFLKQCFQPNNNLAFLIWEMGDFDKFPFYIEICGCDFSFSSIPNALLLWPKKEHN